MKQIKVWTQFGFRQDVVGRVLLEARAGQVIHLFGYRLGLANARDAAFASIGDNSEAQLSLHAAPRAPLNPPGLGTASRDSFYKSRSVLGLYTRAIAVDGASNVGTRTGLNAEEQDWTPCDFMIPGLWMVLVNNQSINVTGMDAQVTALFDWVGMSPQGIAALYTSYGIDSVDATEREAVGNIDFNVGPGGGSVSGGILG